MSVIDFGFRASSSALQSPADRTASASSIAIDSRSVVRTVVMLAAVILFFGYVRELYVAFYGLDTALKNLRIFDLDSEGTLPAWFSSGVLVLCACQLGVIAALARRADDLRWRQWALLAIIFVVLGADEAISLHEIAIRPLRAALGLNGILYFSWVLPAGILVAMLGLYFLPFVFSLPLQHRVRFVASGCIFVGGALGMELVSGYYASSQGFQSLPYVFAMMTEETLELAGSTFFFASLAAYLRERFGTFALAVG